MSNVVEQFIVHYACFILSYARPRVARSVKKLLETRCRDVVSRPFYSPHDAFSDYYLFRAMQSIISGEWYSSYLEVKNCLDDGFFQNKRSSSIAELACCQTDRRKCCFSIEHTLNKAFIHFDKKQISFL